MLKITIYYLLTFIKTFSFAKAKIHEILPAEKVKRELPCNYKSSDADYFQHELNRDICRCYEVNCKKAIVSKEGIIVHNSKIIMESLSGFNPDKNFVSKLYWNNTIKITPEKENICCLFTAWSDNYYHWFAEVVPKFIFMLEKKIINNYIFYFPESHNKQYIIDSLNILKVKYAFFKKHEYVLARNMYFISLTADLGNFRLNLHNTMRDFFSKIVCVNEIKTEPFRRVYISRKKATKRFVVNEDEIIHVLIENDFEILSFENLSLDEQIKLMCETKVLISVHGAGLTNMQFMQQDTSVVEFRLEGDTHMNLFYSLASSLNLRYYYLLCKGLGSKDIHNSNISVDIEKLYSLLKCINT